MQNRWRLLISAGVGEFNSNGFGVDSKCRVLSRQDVIHHIFQNKFRAASNREFNILCDGIGDYIAFDARVVDDQLVIRANSPYRADDPVFYIFTFSCRDFPCITEHLLYYGDLELLRLLSGVLLRENLPSDCDIPPHTPQAWINGCISIAELSAPGERLVVKESLVEPSSVTASVFDLDELFRTFELD